MRRFWFAITIFALALSGLGNAPRAEAFFEANAAKTPCPVQKDLVALRELQEKRDGLAASTSTEEKELLLGDELTLRRHILEATLTCNAEEAERIVETLKDAPLFGVGAKEVQERFFEDFSGVLSYLDEKRAASAKADPETIKAIAREVGEWREEIYIPLAQHAANFLVWAQNDDLIEKANNRLFQIRQTLKTLKLQNQEEIQRIFENSRLYFLQAQESHTRARQGIERRGNSERILADLRQSLDNLHLMYRTLLELSTAAARGAR